MKPVKLPYRDLVSGVIETERQADQASGSEQEEKESQGSSHPSKGIRLSFDTVKL